MYARSLSINYAGRLINLSSPKVMAILNVTPDSFYDGGRNFSEEKIRERIHQIIEEGADIIDVGGCSTHPGFEAPTQEEEWRRIRIALSLIRKENKKLPVSLDTFRSEIVRRTYIEFGDIIVNDIGGGEYDKKLWETVAEFHLPYVLTHNRVNTPKGGNYSDVTAEVITELSWKLHELRKIGICDVIIDPGFGFAKTLEDNYRLMEELGEICRIGCAVLVGISRKSMIYKYLGTGPEKSLTGTIALNAIALEKGANILRVHDIGEAVEVVKLHNAIKSAGIKN